MKKQKRLKIKALCEDTKARIINHYAYLENKLGFDTIDNDNIIDYLSEIIENIEEIKRSCER